MMESTKVYVAFLRGINVGGNTTIKMEALKQAFESLGFTDVKTVLASGNVVFSSPQTDLASLALKIETKLKQTFGFELTTLLRTGAEIQALLDAGPFKDVALTPQTRCHVVFLPEKPDGDRIASLGSRLNESYQIPAAFNREVCFAFELTPDRGTPELMKNLDKVFGKTITVRTWATIIRIGKFLS